MSSTFTTSSTVCASTTSFLRSRFTGKERDSESGNDYFGARYYASSMGRFMSPDWSAKAEPVPYAKLDYPQSLNLYAYVLNNPLSGIDADGHACGESGQPACPVPQTPPAQPAQTNGTPGTGSTIVTVSATSNYLPMVAGAALGEAIDPAGGGVVGALLASTVGVGGSVSYVPSTDSWYAGPTVSFTPQLMGGNGVSANTALVPATQDPNAIANGKSFSVNAQPMALTGSTVTYSPGSGPPVAGPTVGTRTATTTFGASYNVNVTPFVRAARDTINNVVNTVRSWFN